MEFDNRARIALYLACLDIEKMRASALGTQVDKYRIDKLCNEYLYQAGKQEVKS